MLVPIALNTSSGKCGTTLTGFIYWTSPASIDTVQISCLLSAIESKFSADLLGYPQRPVGSYSASKAEAERIALSMSAEGFEVMAVRPRFVWGRDDTTALPQLLAAADSGKFAWIDGGRYRTSTTHIANLAHGIERALLAGTPGEAYFIADADEVEFRSFISAMLLTQGRSRRCRVGWCAVSLWWVNAWRG